MRHHVRRQVRQSVMANPAPHTRFLTVPATATDTEDAVRDMQEDEAMTRHGWIPTRSATPSTALVPQRKVGFPIPNAGLLLGFQGTKTARREGISSPFSDAGGCTSPQNSGMTVTLSK